MAELIYLQNCIIVRGVEVVSEVVLAGRVWSVMPFLQKVVETLKHTPRNTTKYLYNT